MRNNKLMLLLALAFIYGCLDSKSDTQVGCPNAATAPVNNKGIGAVYCGGQAYKTVKIRTQTWMAQNLNYKTSNGKSRCYPISGHSNPDDADNANCTKFGRLYDWVTAMGFDESCYSKSCASQIKAKHQGICPSGWHIPSQTEWRTLMPLNKDGSHTDDPKLIATSGWKVGYLGEFGQDSIGGNGTDTYGFTALPGGYGERYDNDISFSMNSSCGVWLSASESDENNVDYLELGYCGEGGGYSGKGALLSVRCVKD